MKSLRQEQKEQTRERILDAAFDLIRHAGEEEVTMAAVAARAGVTARTVYRHYETRDRLLQSVWNRFGEGARYPQTVEEFIEFPLHLFPHFDERRELARAHAHSLSALQARIGVNEVRQQAVQKVVRDART